MALTQYRPQLDSYLVVQSSHKVWTFKGPYPKTNADVSSPDPGLRTYLFTRQQGQEGVVLHHHFQRDLATMGHASNDFHLGWARCRLGPGYGASSSPSVRLSHSALPNLWRWKELYQDPPLVQAVVRRGDPCGSGQRIRYSLQACDYSTYPG